MGHPPLAPSGVAAILHRPRQRRAGVLPDALPRPRRHGDTDDLLLPPGEERFVHRQSRPPERLGGHRLRLRRLQGQARGPGPLLAGRARALPGQPGRDGEQDPQHDRSGRSGHHRHPAVAHLRLRRRVLGDLVMANVGALGSADQRAASNALTQSSMNPLIQAILGAEAPSIAQYGQSFNAAEAGIGALPASLGLQGAELQQSTGLQGEQLQNQLYGNTLQSQNIAEQLGITNQQYGLQQQLAGIQQGQLTYQEGIAQQQAQSQGAATGTLGTQGYAQKQGQIGEQYQVSSAELANQLAGEGLTNKGANLSAANQQAQLANTAAALGISQQQLQAQLAQGMTQIGIQGAQTQDQLFQQAAQAQAGEAQGVGAIFSNIGALTG